MSSENLFFPVTKDRDYSVFAINKRFDKANLMAIITHNGVVFDSLRDVNFLIDQVKKGIELKKAYDSIELENTSLKEQIIALTEELNNVKAIYNERPKEE